MKIKRKINAVKTYELTEEEANTIKVCLQYCLHRLKSHNNKGIHKMTDGEKVSKLLEEITK